MRTIASSRVATPRDIAIRAVVIVLGGLAALVALALAEVAQDGGALHSPAVQQSDR